MSLIEQLGSDLDTTTRQLEEWVTQAKLTKERLDQQEVARRQQHDRLEGQVTAVRSKLRELLQESTALSTTTRQELERTHSLQAKWLNAFAREAARFDQAGKGLLDASAHAQEGLKNCKGLLTTFASDGKVAFQSLATAGQSLNEGLSRNQQDNLSELSALEQHVAACGADIATKIEALSQQINHHLNQLPEKLSPQSDGFYKATGDFLQDEYSGNVTQRIHHVKSEAKTSVAGLVNNEASAVRDEVKAAVNEFLRSVQKIGDDVPDNLEREGKSTLRSQAEELGEKMLVRLVLSIVSSATTTSVCAEFLPAISAISMGLDVALSTLAEMDN